ncbi:MAG: cysteine desulfurase family protein [Xanthobacteraceae bacterium]|nr:cysteine desulfurase family protein [Xanthobacteraceae bacterium]
MNERVYLDHNATSPLRPPARAAMTAALSAGNASSVHAEGRAARGEIEAARARVAALVGADPKAVTFTSGATESIALALSPELEIEGRSVRCDVLIISAVEHPAVRAGGRFPAGKIEMIPVDHAGVVDFAALELMLARHQAKGQRALVSVMAANNETGVIEPCTKIAELVHAAGGIFHTDAVQIAGRIPFDLAVSGADLISLSSHKLGGPQGVGALIARDQAIRVPAMLRGGGQERGRRAGTENVAAIVGFGIAAECAALVVAEETGRLAGLRDRLEQGIRAVTPDAIFLSAAVARLPNTTCFAVPGIAAETAVIAFDLEGIAVSAGAACSSGKVGPSEALAAMRVPAEIAKGAVRVSLGWSTSESDISRFLLIWERIRSNLSQRRRERAA